MRSRVGAEQIAQPGDPRGARLQEFDKFSLENGTASRSKGPPFHSRGSSEVQLTRADIGLNGFPLGLTRILVRFQ